MPAGGAALSISQMAQVISQWQNNWRYRLDLGRLLELGPHMLADIGLSLMKPSSKLQNLSGNPDPAAYERNFSKITLVRR
jgi:uncharacterized protein YjiS (DUF1127 family)